MGDRPRTPLPRWFFERPTLDVARDLLGATLVRQIDGVTLCGRIVEVEAYIGPEDRASHASRGRTPRTEVMFGPAGHAYVYLVYGMHHCLNVVTEREGYPAAVLIRALEPCGTLPGPTNGSARLCKTLRIDRALNGTDLAREGPLFLATGEQPPRESIIASQRVGVDYAGEWAERPWRLFLKGNPFVSRDPRRLEAPDRYHTAPGAAGAPIDLGGTA